MRRTTPYRYRVATVGTAVIVALPLVASAQPAMAGPDDIQFDEPITVPTGLDKAWSLAHGRFGEAGEPGFLVTQDTWQTVMFVGDGAGGFDPVAGPSLPRDTVVSLGDLDGDGIDDLVGQVGAKPYGLVVRKGTARPGFGAPVTYELSSEPTGSLTLADLDGDTDRDVIVPQYKKERILILENDGDGGLTRASTYPRRTQGEVEVADVDNDDIVDLAMWDRQSTKRLVIARGLGELTYGVAEAVRTPKRVADFTTDDIDGDGNADLTAILNHKFGVGHRLYLRLGKGDGTFGRPMKHEDIGGKFEIADFDRDGAPDLLADCEAHGYCVLPGRGDGTFDPPLVLPKEVGFWGYVVDVDGDGWTDVLTFPVESITTLFNVSGG